MKEREKKGRKDKKERVTRDGERGREGGMKREGERGREGEGVYLAIVVKSLKSDYLNVE